MGTLRRWLARLAGAFAVDRRERDLAEELELHLQLDIEGLLRQGVPPAEARRIALVRSGGIEAAKEAVRRQRSFAVLEHLRRDVRYALRMMQRSPGFTAVTIVSLALGIGANTAVFSLADAVFFRTLPVADPGALVLFEWSGAPRVRGYSGSMRRSPVPGEVIGAAFPVPFFEHVRGAGAVLEGAFAFAAIEQLNVIAGDRAEIARGQLVTGDYYATLGVGAIHGRTITAADDRPGAEPVAVLAHGYWQRRFGGAESVVGKPLMINGIATTVVGITPRDFDGTLDVGQSADVTLPMSQVPAIRPGSEADLVDPDFWWVQIMGRRRSGVTPEQARASLDGAFQRVLSARSGAVSAGFDSAGAPILRLAPGGRGPNDERRDYRLPVTLLTVVAALVLLIACSNAANLLLARAASRRREVAMRLALGANRRRLVAQMLVESIVLVLFAEALGILLAFWGKDLLLIVRPDAAGIRLALDGRALAAATILAAATVLLFGLAPALRATRLDVAGSLKATAVGIRGATRMFISRGSVVMQIAMSVVLLVGAMLFLRTLQNLRAVDVGFDQDALLLFRVDPRLSRYDEERVPLLYRELQRQLATIPGVRAVTFSRHGQLTGGRRTNPVGIVGMPETDESDVLINLVGPGFFETMRLPIVMGRAFDERDDERRARAAIINQTFARTRFAGDNPIGRRIRVGAAEAEIVGIAADAKYYSLRQAAEPVVFLPFLQVERGQASFTLRTGSDPTSFVSAVRDVVRRIDRTLPIFEVQTQRMAVDALLGEERLLATMATAFGTLALVLACIGVYGVLSYVTTQRTSEIGLRIALGASGRSILWLVTRRTAALVALGVVIGLVAGVQGARLSERLLYGIVPADPVSILGAVAVIAIVAIVAAAAPANRARRVSPVRALRMDG